MLDLNKYILDIFGTDAISFKEAGMQIKKTSSVRGKNLVPAEYYEVPTSLLSAREELSLDKLEIKNRGNLNSIENQKLEAYDIIFNARAKFTGVTIVPKELLNTKLPIVSAQWTTVIRAGNLSSARMIQYYLAQPKVQGFINAHKKAVDKKGAYYIGPEVMGDLLLPSFISSDQSSFIEYSDEIDKVVKIFDQLADKIHSLSLISKNSYWKDKNKISKHREHWSLVEDSISGIKQAFDGVSEDIEKKL